MLGSNGPHSLGCPVLDTLSFLESRTPLVRGKTYEPRYWPAGQKRDGVPGQTCRANTIEELDVDNNMVHKARLVR